MKPLVWMAGLLAGCASVMLPEPRVALEEAPFAEKPRIVRRQDDFFLRYRIVVKQGQLTPKLVLVSKKTSDKAYYYFGGPVSHEETGVQVNRPLAFDGFTDLARRNALYWLDPDGSETHLEIRAEPDRAP